MKTSEVLREAARLVAEARWDFPLTAIAAASQDPFIFSDSVLFYKDMYGKDNLFIGEKARNHRVIALLMAAEVAESEGV